jgi:hypothetical protein
MKKIMRIGTMDTGNGRRASIYIKTTIEDGNLSISGVIGPLKSGNALGSCGQIDMGFAHRNKKDDDDERYNYLIQPDEIKFSPSWNKELWFDLLDVWKRWHLKEEIPDTVVSFLESLPETDKTPAWI